MTCSNQGNRCDKGRRRGKVTKRKNLPKPGDAKKNRKWEISTKKDGRDSGQKKTLPDTLKKTGS